MNQKTIFDELYDNYKITKPIRLIEFFAGIGSQAKALERLGANFKHYKMCEWAVPSILAYQEIHQEYLEDYGIDHAKGKEVYGTNEKFKRFEPTVKMLYSIRDDDSSIKTLEYVKQELFKLVDQLIEVSKKERK